MSDAPNVPDNLHDLLNALQRNSEDASLRPVPTETERLLTAAVLKLADEVADLRARLRRVTL